MFYEVSQVETIKVSEYLLMIFSSAQHGLQSCNDSAFPLYLPLYAQVIRQPFGTSSLFIDGIKFKRDPKIPSCLT